ncbi:MAG: hypothetical protein CMF99_01440 [Candidatus Marinimicrobia bacterium]|nr:hypothetical protein [Candidatus Neomarinimicrobiota bacterium]
MIIYKKLKSNFYCFFIFFFVFVRLCLSQVKVGDWNSLTSFLQIRDVEFIENTLYTATEGGILSIKENDYSVITNTNGLIGVDLLSIAKDNNDNLWIGGNSPFGFLQLYDPLNKEPISSFDFQLTAIHDIQVKGSITWILFQDGQDNGLMKFVFDDRWEYRDSYRNYPEEISKINCFIALDSMIFLGTNDGIYSSMLENNLKNPFSWTKSIQDIEEPISSIDSNADGLVFTTDNGLFEYSYLSNQLNQIETQIELEQAQNIFVYGNDYWFSEGKQLYLFRNNELTLIENKYNILTISKVGDKYTLGTDNGIIFLEWKSSTELFEKSLFIPNSPVTNSFSAIEVLEDGRLVGGSNQGLSIFSNAGWRNILEIKEINTEIINESYNYDQFIADTVEYDFGEFISDIEQGPDGLVYCAIRGSRVYNSNPSRWSGGIIVVDIDNPENISTIDTSYLSYYTSSNSDLPYQVVLDVEFDNNGNLWVANPFCTNGNSPIHVRSPNGIWKHFGSNETETSLSYTPISIAFDNNNRIWVSSFQAADINIGRPNGGIAVLSFNGDPFNPNSFFWNQINLNGTVWSLGIGNNDRLYYLTPSGLNYYDLKPGSNPVLSENLYPYFPNISFGSGSKINIDFQGNIWASSSSQGVYVLQENTSYWPNLEGFNRLNSDLLSGEIRDIDFDHKRNLAYIATSNGVSVLKIPFGTPKNDFKNLKIFPSPYYVPSNNPMIIDGIIYESSFKVMTLNGRVIRDITSGGVSKDGQQLKWDGRDSEGNYVSTGVYLLMIYHQDGKNTIEKITVINKS